MIIEIKGKLTFITEEVEIGQDKNKKYELVIQRAYTDAQDEVKHNTYAIQVFPKIGKNEREQLKFFLEKKVTVKANVSSKYWENSRGSGYITNLNLFDIKITENTYKQPEQNKQEVAKEFSEAQIVQEEQEKEIPKTEATFQESSESDDLPF